MLGPHRGCGSPRSPRWPEAPVSLTLAGLCLPSSLLSGLTLPSTWLGRPASRAAAVPDAPCSLSGPCRRAGSSRFCVVAAAVALGWGRLVLAVRSLWGEGHRTLGLGSWCTRDGRWAASGAGKPATRPLLTGALRSSRGRALCILSPRQSGCRGAGEARRHCSTGQGSRWSSLC